ncbi:MAG: AAA family ATPase [Patescibacteria group bacterium]|jgi:dephospho-CoA kinase
MIIGLTGLLGAGKGTATEYIAKKYGAVTKKFSDPIRDIIKRLYQPITREHMQSLGKYLRSEFNNNNIFAETLLNDVSQSDQKLIVLEGFRHKDEYQLFRKRDDFIFVAVEASLEKRFERVKLRPENVGDQNLTLEHFKLQHEFETEQAIPSLITLADFRLDNNGTPEELIKQIDELMKKLGHEIQS